MTKSVVQSVFSMLLANLECHPSAEKNKVSYETALECEALMETFRAVRNQYIDTRQEKYKISLFEAPGYYDIPVKRRQCHLESFNDNNNKHIIDLVEKVGFDNSFGKTNMSRWKTAKFKDIFIAGCI